MTSNEKLLKILLAFTPSNQPMQSVEVSRKLRLNTATVNRILITLKNNGFLVQDEITRRYRLGPAAGLIGRAFKQSFDGRVVAIAKPYLDNLRDRVDETVNFEILQDERVFLAYSAKGKRQLSVTPLVGDQMNINANAGAKVIMAFSPEEMIDRHLSKQLSVYTRNTVSDPEKIRKEYKKIKKDGFAYDREETDDDVNAVAAPVYNFENKVIAAVVIITPSFRMQGCIESGALTLLKETARDISIRLSNV